MKTSKVLLVTLAVTLIAAAAAAQNVQRVHMHGHGPFEMLPFHAVDLTEAQHTQIKQIYESGKSTMTPLFEQAHQNHEAMGQLITGGSFDEAKAQALATQSAQIQSQIELERAKLTSQAYQVLTPEQKTKMTEVLAKRQQWFQQHMQNQTLEAPAEPPSN